MNINKSVKPKEFRKSVSKECEDLINVEKSDTEIPSLPHALDVDSTGITSSEDSDEMMSPSRRREGPEWNPGRHIYIGNYRAVAKQMMLRIGYALG